MKLTNEQFMIKDVLIEEWSKQQRAKIEKYFAEELVNEINSNGKT